MIRRIRPSLAIRIFGPFIPAIRQKRHPHISIRKNSYFCSRNNPGTKQNGLVYGSFTQHSAIQAVVVLSLISVFGMMLGKVRFSEFRSA